MFHFTYYHQLYPIQNSVSKTISFYLRFNVSSTECWLHREWNKAQQMSHIRPSRASSLKGYVSHLGSAQGRYTICKWGNKLHSLNYSPLSLWFWIFFWSVLLGFLFSLKKLACSHKTKSFLTANNGFCYEGSSQGIDLGSIWTESLKIRYDIHCSLLHNYNLENKVVVTILFRWPKF